MPVRLRTLRAIASELFVVRIAIFGVPVVPDVPMNSPTASGSTPGDSPAPWARATRRNTPQPGERHHLLDLRAVASGGSSNSTATRRRDRVGHDDVADGIAHPHRDDRTLDDPRSRNAVADTAHTHVQLAVADASCPSSNASLSSGCAASSAYRPSRVQIPDA